MTSCPLECIFEMGIRSGHHVVRFPWALVWPHHGSPLLRVRRQQGMRAATRMTLARALQLVSTSHGPWAAGTTLPALARTALAPAQRRCFQGCCLVPPGIKPSIRTRRNRIIPAWQQASRIGTWKMVIVGIGTKGREDEIRNNLVRIRVLGSPVWAGKLHWPRMTQRCF